MMQKKKENSNSKVLYLFKSSISKKILQKEESVDSGTLTILLGNETVDFKKLSKIIDTNIPTNNKVHKNVIVDFPNLNSISNLKQLKNISYIKRSLGTLIGSNSYIKCCEDNKQNKYLVISCGSGVLGTQIINLKENNKTTYLNNLNICYLFAKKNREVISNIILSEMFNTNLSDYFYFHKM